MDAAKNDLATASLQRECYHYTECFDHSRLITKNNVYRPNVGSSFNIEMDFR